MPWCGTCWAVRIYEDKRYIGREVFEATWVTMDETARRCLLGRIHLGASKVLVGRSDRVALVPVNERYLGMDDADPGISG